MSVTTVFCYSKGPTPLSGTLGHRPTTPPAARSPSPWLVLFCHLSAHSLEARKDQCPRELALPPHHHPPLLSHLLLDPLTSACSLSGLLLPFRAPCAGFGIPPFVGPAARRSPDPSSRSSGPPPLGCRAAASGDFGEDASSPTLCAHLPLLPSLLPPLPPSAGSSSLPPLPLLLSSCHLPWGPSPSHPRPSLLSYAFCSPLLGLLPGQ